MFRLIGFLIGSITSILIILLLVGMPTFHLNDAAETQERYDAAIDKLRQKQREFESVAGQLTEDVARVAESIQRTVDTAQPETPTVEDSKGLPAARDGLDSAPQPEEAVAIEPVLGEPSWYSFWNPFRSEIAANGFVSQLEKVTGIDYRVVKVDIGVYEVAFAYYDDDERRTKLSQISTATGLELPDS